jgi:hypothetical protein
MRGFKYAIVLLLFIVSHLYLPAEEKDSKPESRHFVVNLSLWYPISLNKSKHDTADINLTLFYGRIGGIKGLDLALGATAVENDMEGFQLAGITAVCGDQLTGAQVSGLFNVCGEDLEGGQISGLLNITGEKGQGFQLAGGMNITGDRFKGFQSSGLFNIVGEEFKGIQACGGFNIVGESCVGFQGTGLFNIVGEEFKGWQLAGLFNIVGGDFFGLQMGTVNIAAVSRGFQIGLGNASGKMRGFQLGLVNWNEETLGTPVGLFNISKKDGRIRWINWFSNISGVNSGVKCEVGRIYSIVALGYWNIYEHIPSSLSYAGFYGATIYQNFFSIGVDVGYMYIDNKQIFQSRPDEADQHFFMVRTLLSAAVSPRISVIGGGGMGYLTYRHKPFAEGKYEPVFFIGLEVF